MGNAIQNPVTLILQGVLSAEEQNVSSCFAALQILTPKFAWDYGARKQNW